MTTIHCIDRAKERAGLNEKRAEKMVALAIERGKTADSFTSWERSYLKGEENDNCIAIAFAGYCYLINYQCECITMYPLPSWFGKKKHFDGKERIRNYKKYCKNNSLYLEQNTYA